MRSFGVVQNENALAQQFTMLRDDARGSSFLLAQQMLGYFTLSTNPSNTQTLTLDINGTNVVFTFVSVIGSTAGNVLIGGTAAATVANLLALLNQPQTTTSTGVALSTANIQLLSYLSYATPSGGTTLYILSNNTNLYAPLTSFSASTTASSDSWTSQTMQLYVHAGTVYVNGTRVLFTGGSTPTVTAPSSHPRIDVLSINSSGTLAWTTGTEASSPSAPTYPSNQIAICELYNVVSETVLYDYDDQQSGQGYIYNDVRGFLNTGLNTAAIPDSLIPSTASTYDLGSSANPWRNLYGNGATLTGLSVQQITLISETNLVAGTALSAGQAVYLGSTYTNNVIQRNAYGRSTSSSGSISLNPLSESKLIVYAVASTSVSGVTLGSNSLTQVGSSITVPGTALVVTAWYLDNPPSGSNTVTVSGTGAIGFDWEQFDGCASGTPEANNSATLSSSTGTFTLSVTSVANNAWQSAGVVASRGDFGSFSGCTELEEGGNTAGGDALLDSNGPKTPAGSVSFSMSNASSCAYAGIIISLAPYSGTPTTFQLLNPASASTSTTATGFIGFMTGALPLYQPISSTSAVAVAGIVTGLSGLTPGNQYYLSNTAGAISTSAGSYTRKVGIALSTTTLLITNVW